MQSAVGCFRKVAQSKCIQHDEETAHWGIGTDGLVLSGNYSFKVLRGCISICGINIAANSSGTWQNVSATVAPFPIINSILQCTEESDNLISDDLSSYSSVIAVKASPTEFFPNLSEIAPQFKQLWHQTVKYDREELDPSLLVQIPKSWKDITLEKTKIFLVLGPQKSGKSTFSRFLVNRLLSEGKNRDVYYLELDPGQPEYTPPGDLTLHLVKDLNFSPAYAHVNLQGSVRSVHFGYDKVTWTPQRYLDICAYLFDVFDTVSKNEDVLIVNTPACAKGVTTSLNVDIARMLEGERINIIHMGSSNLDISCNNVDKPLIPSDASTNETNSEGTKNLGISVDSYSNSMLTNLRVSCYLHQFKKSAITQWPPYNAFLGTENGVWSVGVMDSAGMILPDDLAICVEGTLVSINLVPRGSDITPFCMTEPEANEVWKISKSIGLGVVQSIDSRSINILTPQKINEIDFSESMIVLIRGRITLPYWEIASDTITTDIPWVSTKEPVGIGGSYTKFRRNIQRY